MKKPRLQGLSLKQVLRELDDWGARASDVRQRDLWAILTGLRGPDREGAWTTKMETTAIIRTKSLPRLAKELGADERNEASKETLAGELEKGLKDSATGASRVANATSPHFAWHAHEALRAIKENNL